MKLTLCVLLALLCGAAWGQNAQASTGLTVFVTNTSTAVTDAQLLDALPVFQNAVSQDFAQAWGVDASLYLTKTPPAGAWTLNISDNSTVIGALGYHWLLDGSPVGYVFARTSIDHSISWQEVFTHELFEMLADPWVNRIAIGGKLWLVEVSDPVEDGTYNYQRLSPTGQTVQVSDFILPNWYRARSKAPYDFTRNVSKPFQLLQNGYASYWENGHWSQLFGHTQDQGERTALEGRSPAEIQCHKPAGHSSTTPPLA